MKYEKMTSGNKVIRKNFHLIELGWVLEMKGRRSNLSDQRFENFKLAKKVRESNMEVRQSATSSNVTGVVFWQLPVIPGSISA